MEDPLGSRINGARLDQKNEGKADVTRRTSNLKRESYRQVVVTEKKWWGEGGNALIREGVTTVEVPVWRRASKDRNNQEGKKNAAHLERGL